MRVSSFIYWYRAERQVPANELAGNVETWEEVSSGWCDRKGVSGREHLVGGAKMISEQTHTIYTHHDPAINERCRIVVEDQIYSILSIVVHRNRYMTIMARANV